MKVCGTRVVICDPATGLFAGKNGDFVQNKYDPRWTVEFKKIATFSTITSAMDNYRCVALVCPDAVFREVKITMEIADTNLPVSNHFASHQATYDRLLPQYEADAESMSEKEWEAFKRARTRLRAVGLVDKTDRPTT